MQKPQVIWNSHRDEYERASAEFSASYMSNAKWHKVLSAIINAAIHAELKIGKATWKFIDDGKLYNWGLPPLEHLLPTHIADGPFMPVEYKWIEWIRFPSLGQSLTGTEGEIHQDQDREALAKLLTKIGKFQYHEDEQGLTLYGYGK